MNEILGCYVSVSTSAKLSAEEQSQSFKEGRMFRQYIWGEYGVMNILKQITSNSYGNDLKLILFEFYINPQVTHIEYISKGFNYKKKEKSIGVPILIGNTFFDKSEDEKLRYIRNIILNKLSLLIEFAKEKKIDFNVDLLQKDLQGIWIGHSNVLSFT
jgi:hypothetical protein